MKKGPPKAKEDALNVKRLAAAKQIKALAKIARKQGPDQGKAIAVLVRLLGYSCLDIIELYDNPQTRPIVEKVALKCDYFPALLTNSRFPFGKDLIENLKLAPDPLKKGRPHRTSGGEAMRRYAEFFTDLIHDPERFTGWELDTKIGRKLRSPKFSNDHKAWAKEFTRWMQMPERSWFVAKPSKNKKEWPDASDLPLGQMVTKLMQSRDDDSADVWAVFKREATRFFERNLRSEEH